MLKIKLLITIICFSLIHKVQSQQEDTSIVGLNLGYVQNGMGIGVNYDYYLQRGHYLQGNILFSFSSEKVTPLEIKVPYEKIFLNAGYFREIYYTTRGWVNVNVGGGVSLGYHIINNGNKELSSGALIKSDSKFVYGLFLGLDNKIFLSDKYTLGVSYRQFYSANSDIGKFSPYIGVSINYALF